MQTNLLTLSKTYFHGYKILPASSWRGIFFNLIESTLIGIFYFLPLYFVNILHLNVAIAGSIVSFYGFGAILGSIVSGKLSDKISPLTVSASSLFLQSLGFFALIKLHTVPLLMLDLFILGIASYGFITSNYVWILSYCEETHDQRLKAINLLSTVSNLGFGIAATIISATVHYGFNYLFFASSFLIFCLACHLFFQEKPSHHHENNIETNDPILETVPKNTFLITSLILSCVFFIGMIIAQLSSTYAIYVQTIFPQLGIKAVSILFTLNSVLVALFSTVVGDFFGHYNRVRMVGLGGFFIGFGMFILCLSQSLSLAIIACIIYTLGEILFFCMAQYVCYQLSPKQSKGHSLGLFRMIFALSRVVGPAGGGFIYHHLGGNMVWYLSGLIGLICLTVCNYAKGYA